MKAPSRTKRELMDELDALRDRVAELERHARDSDPPIARMQEAMFVIFDRKMEFVNDRFVELFGVSAEEACRSNFDPMTLIAPESRSFIGEQYRKGCCGAFTTRQLNFTGLSKFGQKIECEAHLIFIPYKWGVATHGTLHSISMSRRIDKTLQRDHSDLWTALSAVPAGIPCVDMDYRLIKENEPHRKLNVLPMKTPSCRLADQAGENSAQR